MVDWLPPGSGDHRTHSVAGRYREHWSLDMGKYLVVLGILFAGVCLMLMPQIHVAVVQANELYALGLRPDLPPETSLARLPIPAWFFPASTVRGAACLIVGLVLARRLVSNQGK